MIQEEFKVRVIKPTEGHLLTQANDDVEIQNRVFSDKVFLAVTDSVENWKEISIEEADAIKAEQERLAQEEMNKNA
jgi:hypothetical protein